MNIEKYRTFCLSLNYVTEDFPFNESTLVFKVGGKMFVLTDVDTFESINLKCDPEKAIELREQYPAVLPGYHMNKKHWNTIVMNNTIPDHIIEEWTKESYQLVYKKLSKKQRNALEGH